MQLKVGKDEPVITNKNGGKQTKLDYGFYLIDAKAMFKLAEVLNYGAGKYEKDNWRKIPVEDHINHALAHIFAYMAGDEQDDHLSHAFCRLMMAVALEDI